MPTYNYSEISAFEFEELCCDLLQNELGLSLEMFAPGPDRGIDIRYIGDDENEDPNIVGQCKRWAEHSFSKLIYHLKKEELPKIRRLAPQRYILMTSVGMTPDQKDKIAEALDPWIKTPNDVLGKQDIDRLLAKHTDVEKRHIKLWLTSTEVLAAVLKNELISDINIRSEDALFRAKNQLRLWVPNPSFERSREILENDHVCVISGAPGIGKTMLADILVTDYAARGYQHIAISEDIKEGDRAWRSETPQVFLYDDFLGHVTYGELRLRKNEQSRLADFFERVRNSDNKRFILTTREYILSEALQRYERLSDAELVDSKCLVSLEDYTRSIRARILYNHLFFSDLPKHLKNALLPEKRYWHVIGHRNYNPRVIEHAVSLTRVDSLSSEEFVSNIFATLKDPTKVWERVFENLPSMARNILRAIASFPTDVFLEDVQDVVRSLSPSGFEASEFKVAIRMIEGTFINLHEAVPGSNNRQRVVTVRDPSVHDYLWQRMEEVDGEAAALLDHAVFFEQCVALYEGRNHVNAALTKSSTREQARDVVNHAAVAARAVELVDSPTSRVEKWLIGDSLSTKRAPVNLERRIAFLLEVLTDHPTNRCLTISAREVLTTVIDSWEKGQGSLGDLMVLLRQASKAKDSIGINLVARSQRALLALVSGRRPDKEVFEVVVGLSKLNPFLLTKHEFDLATWKSKFEEFLVEERDWLLWDIDDPDWLGQEIWDIGRVAAVLGTDISDLEAQAHDRIASLSSDREPDGEDDVRDFYADTDGDTDVAQIDALFESLGSITEP